MKPKRLRLALAAAATAGLFLAPAAGGGSAEFDPLLDGAPLCAAPAGGPPALLRHLVLAAAETAPFQPAPPRPALGEAPVLYANLGTLSFKAGTRNARAQAWFDQGIRLAFAFNHAEAQRAFREAQKEDPRCALCFWGEALVLGPNINVPMMPEASGPALAALAKAVELEASAPARDRFLIEALAKRYSADPKAERAALDAAYADAMAAVAQRYPGDDTILTLYAEAMMDTQPWDYWEAGGAKPKGRGAAIVATLEQVLERNPRHPGAIHLYIHAVEASTQPGKALPYANRLPALMPGAGHLVHMPAHIYYRVGMYRESLAINKRAMAADEAYFRTSPSDPLYKAAYYPHNIHFLMVSAQMGGDGTAAIAAAAKLDAAMPAEVVAQFAIMQPVKAAPYTTHAQFAAPDASRCRRRPRTSRWLRRSTATRARSRSRRRRTSRRRAPRSKRSRASAATRTGSRSPSGACPRRRSSRPRASSRPAASPTPPATSTAPRRPTRTRSSSRTRSRTRSRRTGTTRCDSRWARCGCGRAGSTRRRRRSASRSRACATTAGRSPGSRPRTSARATRRRRARRSARTRRRGSATRRDLRWTGCSGQSGARMCALTRRARSARLADAWRRAAATVIEPGTSTCEL